MFIDPDAQSDHCLRGEAKKQVLLLIIMISMKVGNSYIPNRVGIRALNLTDTEILGGPIFSSNPVEIKVYLRAWFFSFSDVTAKALKLPTLIRFITGM